VGALGSAGIALTALALVPQRAWLDHLALVVPGPCATRWLLVLDVACLVALGLERRRLAVPLALGAGFLGLNVLAMAVTEFFLGLALFHVAVALTATLILRRYRWLGLAALAVVLTTGMLT
jgi:hypothetical protein